MEYLERSFCNLKWLCRSGNETDVGCGPHLASRPLVAISSFELFALPASWFSTIEVKFLQFL